MPIPNSIKDRRGSAVIWALAVGSFLMIILIAILSISLFYGQRSLDNNDNRQAYLTARAGVDLIVQAFLSDNENSRTIYTYLSTNTKWNVADIGFENDMGTCALEVTLDAANAANQTITVKATAVKSSSTKTITAILTGTNANWTLAAYKNGQ